MKINIKTAPTHFSVVTPSSGSALYYNALPDDGVTTLKRVGAGLPSSGSALYYNALPDSLMMV